MKLQLWSNNMFLRFKSSLIITVNFRQAFVYVLTLSLRLATNIIHSNITPECLAVINKQARWQVVATVVVVVATDCTSLKWNLQARDQTESNSIISQTKLNVSFSCKLECHVSLQTAPLLHSTLAEKRNPFNRITICLNHTKENINIGLLLC